MLHAVNLNTTAMLPRAGQAGSLASPNALQASSLSLEHRPEPLVSVIIPCYNNGKYIEECVRSVLNQTYTNFEIIIINDASTDDSAQKIEKLQKENPQKITVITNKKNLERSASRNTGIAKSKGELVCILDGDDRWYPQKLTRQVQAMQEDPELAFCGTGRDLLDKDSKIETSNSYFTRSGEIFLHLLARRCSILTSSVMLRRSIINKVGGFDRNLNLAEDFDYWVRASFLGRYKHIPEELVSYRIHEAQSTSPSNLKVDKINKTTNTIAVKYTKPSKLKEYFKRVRSRGGYKSETHIYLKPGCNLKNRVNLFSQNLFSKLNPDQITRKEIQQIGLTILSLEFLEQAKFLTNVKRYSEALKLLKKSKKLDPRRLIDPTWLYYRIKCRVGQKKAYLNPAFNFSA